MSTAVGTYVHFRPSSLVVSPRDIAWVRWGRRRDGQPKSPAPKRENVKTCASYFLFGFSRKTQAARQSRRANGAGRGNRRVGKTQIRARQDRTGLAARLREGL